MKKKLVFTAILSLLLVTGASAQSGTTGDLTWMINNGTLTISGNGAMPDFVLREAPWSDHWQDITSVIINNGVANIGNFAFSECSSLASVIISGSVTSIGSSAFYRCSALASIAIPSSVTSIGNSAFENCIALVSIDVNADNVTYASDDGILYNKSKTELIWYPTGKTDAEFTIPGSVIIIGNNAFRGSIALTSVTIPSSVTTIESNAFNGSRALTSVTIPGSVTTIGSNAFFNCMALTSVIIENGVKNIGGNAFAWCSRLNEVNSKNPDPPIITSNTFAYISASAILYVPVGRGASYAATLWSSSFPGRITEAYSGTTGNLAWTINNGTLTISGNGAMLDFNSGETPWYEHREGITSAVIGNGVTSIGDYAFYNCIALASVIIEDNVENIGDYAFAQCSSLNEVNSKNPNPPTIADDTFTDIAESAILYVPVGSGALYAATTLWYSFFSERITEVQSGTIGDLTWIINNGTLTISGNGAMLDFNYRGTPWYEHREGVTSVVIGNGVTSIGNFAFGEFSALTSVIIPGSAINIGNFAFSRCSTLASITIPDGVTSIGNFAFSECLVLTSVTIPGSVTNIMNGAFVDCLALASVIIPDGVTSIGGNVFNRCSALLSVAISASVVNIGNFAFRDCIALVSIDVNADNTVYTSDGGILYNKTKTELICYPAGKPDVAFIIPEIVTSIGIAAFYSCIALESITIPENVTSIGDGAFNNCSALTSVTIPGSIANVGGYAFYNCVKLASVIIEEGVESIGDYAFAQCSSLSEVNSKNPVPPTISDDTFTDIAESAILYVPVGSGVLYTATTLWNSFFPERITEVHSGTTGDLTWMINNGTLTISGNGAIPDFNYGEAPWYEHREGITSMVIGNGVTSIGYLAFSGLNVLASVTIPGSVTSIGGFAFSECSALTSVTIPENVTSIGDYAFSECLALTSVTIPDGVTSIGEGAFIGCTQLVSIDVNTTNTAYASDGGVLYNNSKTELICYPAGKPDAEFIVPGSVIIIGNNAFYNSMALTSVTIPGSVTTIGDGAFSWCYVLASVTIDSGVTSIGDSAFTWCFLLGSIDVNATNTAYASEDGVLYNKSKTELICYPAGKSKAEFTVPGSVTTIENFAFTSCVALASVTIEEGVESIGDFAFVNCTSLSEVNSRNPVPPTISDDTFTNIAESAILYVPVGSGESYTATMWNSFFSERITEVHSGTTGDLTWMINNGTLTISGNGAIPDFNYGRAPWYEHREDVTSVVIGNGVTSIGNLAFSGLNVLASVTIPGSVISIGDFAFSECSALTSVTIPENVTSIGDYALSECLALTSVTIPDGVTSIGEGAFIGCTRLVSIDVNTTNTAYASDGGILYNNSKTELICYPAGKSDAEFIIPEIVTSIGIGAFYSCIALKSVTIPSSVTSIGDGAFSNCSSLNEVNSKNPVPPTISDETFTDIAESAILYVPKGSLTSYASTPWNIFFSKIEEEESDIDTSEGSVSADVLLRVYPNPALDIITIEGLPAGATVILYNLTGEAVIESAASTIDVSALPSGIYIATAAGKTVKVMKK